MGFPFREIEIKWRKYWDENNINKTDPDKLTNKIYCLVMFSYPSADKLHLGHWFNYSPVDTWARFKRMQGFNLFQPMGFDSFGLPAENFAVKTGVHPQDTTETSIKYIREQLKNIGAMYDWDYEVITSRPDYYKWTQWIFLELYKNKLAYRKEAPVNWCPSCQTVLANEQVKDGTCERCDSLVEKKNLTQWFFNITKYAEELLQGLEKLDWPEKTKLMQQNWIGKSSGMEITFTIDNESKDAIKVFTTRSDTLFGATYMVLAPEHPLIEKITSDDKKDEVEAYIQKSVTTSEIDRVSTVREKSGVFTGCNAINPINNEKIPIWIADYVLITYGTGAIMAVPAHDERDFEFATKFDLNIRKVILAKNDTPESELNEAYTGEGKMMNSGEYDGMDSKPGGIKVSEYLESKDIGKRTIQYKLRDWLVSRQRYWGAPIPIIYCDKCGEGPVPEKDLPVLLPYDDVDFKPKGKAPLATSESFVNTTCPKCGEPAKREVDTMDTFVDSSWYFLRYPFNKMEDKAWDYDAINYWMPVDKYVGGAEHATMHLLYARFFTKALRDMGYLNFDEPFLSLVHQGVIKGPDGLRMSKSKGNVINPEDYLEKYGSDVFRCYLMFGFEYITGGPWDDTGIAAIDRFLNRIWRLVEENKQIFGIDHYMVSKTSDKKEFPEADKSLNRVLNNSIKGVTQDTERFHFNTAVSRIMELVNELYKYTSDVDEKNYNTRLLCDSLTNLILLIAPFAPHLAEEMWRMTGKKDKTIFDIKWPEFDEKALELDEIDWVVQINGKIREHMHASKNLSKNDAEAKALIFGRIPALIEGKTVRKVIVVPQKLINIVVS
jgi:leucyl-tRNA synthetase